MYGQLLEFFLTRPSRIIALGSALTRCAGFVVVAGLAARLVTLDASALVRSGVSQHGELAQVLPTLPTWWVPESVFGFGLAGLGIVCGLYLCVVGKRLRAMLGD